MRTLYDHFGRDAILTNNAILVNGLGDLVEDSQKLRGQFRMALDAGMGRLYIEQLTVEGKPDANFVVRVRTLLTDSAGLSDKAAGEIIDYMDEMIGWRKETGAKPQPESVHTVPSEAAADPREEIDRETGKPYRKTVQTPAPQTESEHVPPSEQHSSKTPKKNGGRIIAAILALALVTGCVVYFLNRKDGVPIIEAINWSEEKDAFEIIWDSNGGKGPWEVYSRYVGTETWEKKGITYYKVSDLKTNSTGDGFFDEHSKRIPGKTYEWRIIDRKKGVESNLLGASVPFNKGTSPLTVDYCEISDMTLSGLITMIQTYRDAYKNVTSSGEYVSYDAVLFSINVSTDIIDIEDIQRAAIDEAISAAIRLTNSSSTLSDIGAVMSLRYLLVSPSGQCVYSDDFVSSLTDFAIGSDWDIGDTVGACLVNVYGGREDEIETGIYTFEVYDWENKDLLISTTFRVSDV